jgi:hypothetical protein
VGGWVTLIHRNRVRHSNIGAISGRADAHEHRDRGAIFGDGAGWL